MLLHVCTFLTFFFTQVFAPFHICASLFFCFLFFILSFFIALFLYPIFTRTLVIALNIFLPCASIYATIRLSLSVFIRLNPCATPGFLRPIYLLTPPGQLLSCLFCPLQDGVLLTSSLVKSQFSFRLIPSPQGLSLLSLTCQCLLSSVLSSQLQL